METRANYILIGAFTLATIVFAFVFIYWFEHLTTGISRVGYRVVFESPIAGLRSGAPVTFNGVRIGEVSRVDLNPTNSRQAVATILVDGATPIRADTSVSLEFQGLTGIATLALRGGTNAAGKPTVTDGDYLVLVADASATQDVMEGARSVMRRVEKLLEDNEASVKNSLKNIETFSAALAANAEKIDRVMTNADRVMASVDRSMGGIEKLTGTASRQGELSETLETFRNAANNAIKDWHALAVDGRRAIGTAEQVFKNIDRNPSRLIFGGGTASAAPAEGAAPAAAPRPAAPRPAAQPRQAAQPRVQ
jgi:phospholipid/cholesterol/gamma-HCH transport system substrate-binding protein